MTNEELADALDDVADRVMNQPFAETCREAARRLRAMPEGERIEGVLDHYGIKKGFEYITLGVPFGSLPSPMPDRATLVLHTTEGGE